MLIYIGLFYPVECSKIPVAYPLYWNISTLQDNQILFVYSWLGNSDEALVCLFVYSRLLIFLSYPPY